MSRRKHTFEDTLAGDLQLVEAWRAGDPTAKKVLLEHNRAALERYLQSKHLGEIGDLVQEVHLACRESLDKYNGLQRYQGYMIGIARHVVFAGAREASKRGREEDVAAQVSSTPASTPSESLRSEETAQLLRRALNQLPDAQRDVLERYFFAEKTEKAIAEELGVPLGTVKTRKRDAQQRLRGILADLGATRSQIRLTMIAVGDSESE